MYDFRRRKPQGMPCRCNVLKPSHIILIRARKSSVCLPPLIDLSYVVRTCVRRKTRREWQCLIGRFLIHWSLRFGKVKVRQRVSFVLWRSLGKNSGTMTCEHKLTRRQCWLRQNEGNEIVLDTHSAKTNHNIVKEALHLIPQK